MSDKRLFFSIFLLFVLKLNLSLTMDYKFLDFDLQTNRKNQSYANYFEYLYRTSNLYANIQIGSNKQPILLRFSIVDYPTFILDKNLISNPQDGFDKDHSKTYKSNKETVFIGLDNSLGSSSTDNIYLKNGKNKYIELNDFAFAYITQAYIHSDFHDNAGQIGVGLYQLSLSDVQEFSFINQLKKRNLIDNYSLTFNCKNYDTCRVLLGNEPEIIDKEFNKLSIGPIKPKSKDYNKDMLRWGINFNAIYYNYTDENNINTSFECLSKYTVFDINSEFILSTDTYSTKISVDFFGKLLTDKKCTSEKVKFMDCAYMVKCVPGDYLKNHPVLKFKYLTADNKIGFVEFDYKDLFIIKDNVAYYNIVLFYNYGESSVSFEWTLGKPFFIKYPVLLNQDNKIIKIFSEVQDKTKKNGTNFGKVFLYTICIVFAIILVLIFIKIIFFNKKIKKVRANELEENVLYSSNNETDDNSN